MTSSGRFDHSIHRCEFFEEIAMDFVMEVNDPIHGFIGLTEIEAKVVDSEWPFTQVF